MSYLFGSGGAKMQGNGTPDSNSVDLDYIGGGYEYQYQIPDVLEQTSVIDGTKTFLKRVASNTSEYSNFTITIFMEKYGTASQQRTKFQEINKYNGQLVYFTPHRDKNTLGDGLGEQMQDSSSNPVEYFLSVVGWSSADGFEQLPRLTLSFTSTKYTDVEKLF